MPYQLHAVSGQSGKRKRVSKEGRKGFVDEAGVNQTYLLSLAIWQFLPILLTEDMAVTKNKYIEEEKTKLRNLETANILPKIQFEMNLVQVSDIWIGVFFFSQSVDLGDVLEPLAKRAFLFIV